MEEVKEPNNNKAAKKVSERPKIYDDKPLPNLRSGEWEFNKDVGKINQAHINNHPAN